MQLPVLRDLVVIVAVAIPVVALLHRLRVPAIVSFLLAGIAIGPTSLRLVRSPESVAALAEIGVVLLLFAVGLELSLSRVMRMGRLVLMGGTFQVVGTTLVVALLARAGSIPWATAIVIGGLVALSSTAIVLKSYGERGELDSPHGRVVVAVLLFQDLCVVPFMLALPLLAGVEDGFGGAVRQALLALGVVAALTIGGRILVPRILARIVALRVPELFTLSIVAIGLGAAYITSSVGLSLALGAFLVGLIISESEYGLQALSDILPFRDAFSGIFFVSVGMLLDLRHVLAYPATVLGAAAAIIVVKIAIVVLMVRVVRRSLRVGLLSALSLSQVGEFSFVVAGAALPLGLLTSSGYQTFLGASILTMVATPVLIALSERTTQWLLQYRAMPTMEFATREARAVRPLSDHVIIVGYGLNGRNLARALQSAAVPYVALEEQGGLVRRARLEHEHVLFGDGTRPEVLERVGIRRARVIVFAIASLADTRRGVTAARHLNPSAHIVARTRYVAEIAELRRLGADEVVPEEFETSLEIFARVLRRYHVSASRIRDAAEEARRDHYELLRERGAAITRVDEILSPVAASVSMETTIVRRKTAGDGSRVADLPLSRTGATLVAIVRGGHATFSPPSDLTLRAGDEVVLVGAGDAVENARALFQEERSDASDSA
jgi:CPA2 family monovalent cation:H+ antiporter-2